MASSIDLKGKVAFIAGVADSSGYGWAIARALADAGATIIVGTWPPVLNIFQMGLRKGQFDEDSKLSDGSTMKIEKIYPLDAVFDEPDDVPDEIKQNKRYAGLDGYTISEVAKAVAADYGKIDIVVHSLANGPEVTKPLLETSRKGYLAASSASAYSAVSLLQKFAPMMNDGGAFLSLTYIASEKVIPGYGGGMSTAKAQLESDTRTLAFEAGRKYAIRVNTISAGPLKSRAASAIGSQPGKKTFIEKAIDYSIANAPLAQDLYNDDVGNAALFLCSPMARCVTGITMYVDNGLSLAMSQTLRQRSTMSDKVAAAGDTSLRTDGSNTGLKVQSMERASPQHTGRVRKLRIPFLYSMLPQFLKQVVLKVWCFTFLRPIWQSRYLMVLGSYLYKFKDDDGRNLLNQQPNGSPIRLDQMNVYLVTTRSAYDDQDAQIALSLLNKTANDDASCIFCVATFRKRYYYACSNHEEALLWVNTLREACQECVTRTMGHALQDSFPRYWKYYDALGDDLVNHKDRIRTRLIQSNLRELEMNNFTEGGPLPRGYYG